MYEEIFIITGYIIGKRRRDQHCGSRRQRRRMFITAGDRTKRKNLRPTRHKRSVLEEGEHTKQKLMK